MIRSTVLRRTLIILLALTFVIGLGAPLAAAQDGGEPRTVTDAIGRQATIEAPPQRVVGLSASMTEILFAIGVTPVGVTEAIEYPPAALDLPTFGTGYSLDLEALAALEPDLIIANAQLQAEIIDQLEAIAPTVYALILTAGDVPTTARLLGQATWHDTSAEYLATSYDDFLDLASMVATSKEGPSIAIIVGMLQVPNYGKSETYLGDLAARLGATNIADGEEDAGPFPGYAMLSVEAVLDADPDVILTITRGAPGTPPIPEAMADDPIWSETSAFQNGRVYELDNRLFLESPGPRFVEALLTLYDVLYGEGME